jgi:hypothetical protein
MSEITIDSIFWMTYLAVLAMIAINSLIKGMVNTVLKKLDFLISIFTWTGLLAYVTNIQILTPIVWKTVFVVGLIWDIFFCFYITFLEKEHFPDDEEIPLAVRINGLVIGLAFLAPLYYGLYQYAFAT